MSEPLASPSRVWCSQSVRQNFSIALFHLSKALPVPDQSVENLSESDRTPDLIYLDFLATILERALKCVFWIQSPMAHPLWKHGCHVTNSGRTNRLGTLE